MAILEWILVSVVIATLITGSQRACAHPGWIRELTDSTLADGVVHGKVVGMYVATVE
jgi:hypothetical protein